MSEPWDYKKAGLDLDKYEDTIARMARMTLKNLLAVLDGARPEQVVNPEVYKG